MRSHTLVCPDSGPLLERVRSWPVVLSVDGVDSIAPAIEAARGKLQLRALSVHVGAPLSAITVSEAWCSLPLALWVTGVGRFRDLSRQLPILRRLNVRIFVPADTAENFSGIRLLSSLGIETAVVLGDEGTDWERLSDLMAYAFFGLSPRAPIEPFRQIAENYDPGRRNDFGTVYFDDPLRYLHLDEQGRVAASARELACGTLLAENPDGLDAIDSTPAYFDRINKWRDVFLQPEGCASCPGWRFCLARFPGSRRDSGGCVSFFTELMDSVERYRALRDNRTQPWRP